MSRWKKPLKISLITLLCLCVAAAAAALGLSEWVKHRAAPMMMTAQEAAGWQKADCILVLGCGVRPDGTPSPLLKDRLDMGIRLYQAGAAPKLLMSGDHGRKTYDEVNTMKRYAIKAGTPSEDIFMDHAGFSTYESMYRARDIFKVKNMLIVTQQYHLSRALYIADSLGMDVRGVASDSRSFAGQAKRDIREVLARDKDFFTSIFKPKPTYLGESIPVSGSGDLTND